MLWPFGDIGADTSGPSPYKVKPVDIKPKFDVEFLISGWPSVGIQDQDSEEVDGLRVDQGKVDLRELLEDMTRAYPIEAEGRGQSLSWTS